MAPQHASCVGVASAPGRHAEDATTASASTWIHADSRLIRCAFRIIDCLSSSPAAAVIVNDQPLIPLVERRRRGAGSFRNMESRTSAWGQLRRGAHRASENELIW